MSTKKITKTHKYCSLITLSINCLTPIIYRLSVWVRNCILVFMMQLPIFLCLGFRCRLVFHVHWCCLVQLMFRKWCWWGFMGEVKGTWQKTWRKGLKNHFYNIVSPKNIKSVINFIKLSKDKIKMLIQDGLEFLLFKSHWFMNMWESFHYLISVQFIRHFVLFWVEFLFHFFLLFLVLFF